MRDIKVGCCGFPIDKKDYYSRFGVIEVNLTFYQPPKISTLLQWRNDAPSDFKFIIKAWQLITHHCGCPTYRRLKMHIPEEKRRHYGNFKPTDEVLKAWDMTLECARALKARLILFQTPPTFGPTFENRSNMKKFFNKIDKKGLKFIWEPRGKWLESGEEIGNVCRDLDLIHCVIDSFRYKSLAGDIDYFRLHGKVESGHIDYNYHYDHGELKALLDMCRRKESYCMFNNSTMYENCIAFLELIERSPTF